MRPLRALVLLVALAPSVGAAERLIGDDGAVPQHDVDGAFREVSASFSQRLLRLHPPGSPVADLVTALKEEGFVLEGQEAARREEPGFLCRLGWIVRWTTEGETLATIEGER